VSVPRIEEIFGRGTFTRPMPEHAAVLGQRGRQVLRPSSCDAVGGAAPAGPHAAASIHPLAHPPRRSPRSARCGPVTPTGRDQRHIGGAVHPSAGKAVMRRVRRGGPCPPAGQLEPGSYRFPQAGYEEEQCHRSRS
jgi:hypothetical protein